MCFRLQKKEKKKFKFYWQLTCTKTVPLFVTAFQQSFLIQILNFFFLQMTSEFVNWLTDKINFSSLFSIFVFTLMNITSSAAHRHYHHHRGRRRRL